MSGSWWKVALALSLACNLFVLGAVAGVMGARMRMEPPRQAAPGGNPLIRAGDQLPPEQRAAYRARMRLAAAAAQPHAREAREARVEAARLFAEPEFDKVAATQALDRARTAELGVRQALEGAVVDFAAGLDTPERRLIADGLRRPAQGRPGGRGGRRGGFGPEGPPMAPPGMDGRPEQ